MPPHYAKFLLYAALLVVTVCSVYGEGVNKTLSEKYERCLDKDQSMGAMKVYQGCLSVPPNSTVKDECDIQDESKCIMYVADIPNFQNCIGPENLKTLIESGNIFHVRYQYFCKDGAAVVKKYIQHDGVNCQLNNNEKFEGCAREAGVPIAKTASQLETLSGFTYDEPYCRALKKYHNCTIIALEDCHPAVVEYWKLNNDLYWKAVPCAGSHLVSAPAILTASGLLLIALMKMMKL